MDKYSSNQPNAAKLLESLRSSGYDNYSAIADLIDNSFDANADQVKVDIGSSAHDDYIITIADNGDGMDAGQLDQALKLGSISAQDNETLGKYGMGLITASISIGRRLVVITKQAGKFTTGIHDLDEIAARNEFIKQVRPSDENEIMLFTTTLGTAITGTIVIIQKVDNLQNHNITAFGSKLIKECGETFRDFLLANKVLTVNRKVVMAVDPMMRKDSGTDEFLDKTQDFVDEKGEQSTIRVRIFHLPELTQAEARDRKVNITNQGFYLMRNNRQIARGESLGIFSKHNDFNRFRAEVYFNGSMDKKIGVNFKKQNISLSDDIRSWIEKIAHPQLDAIRDIAKKKQSREKTVIDHQPAQRAIASKKSVIKKPRIEEDTASSFLKPMRSDAFTNVEFREEHNTHLAPLYQVQIHGEKILINYNADHIFYQTVFAGGDKELVNAIDSLVYSTAVSLIGITSSEQRIHLKDEFLDTLSDNLRTLLS